jgi:MoxR-like ATPase
MTPRDAILELRRRMQAAIVGQPHAVDRLLIALLANGHLLFEGLPGVAKTRTVKTLAAHLDAEFRRIQFTPDLLPADVTGADIYLGEAAPERFAFQPGPIFANLVLADEINRAPAKVQSALLEAMEERQVTVGGTTHPLPPLFLVLATQNPIEQEGTYPLPEAQTDRFLLHVFIPHPDDATELDILRLVRAEGSGGPAPPAGRIPQQAVFDARAAVAAVESSPLVDDYIVALVAATRRPALHTAELAQWIQVGVSPRGSLALDRAARAHAWLAGREYVTPDDVRAVAHDCLRHRLILSYEATAAGVTPDRVIDEILRSVAVA